MTDQADFRCPQCAALVRPGSQWCTLCFADLRPAPAPAPVAVLEPSYAGANGQGSVDPLTAPLSPLAAAAQQGVAAPAEGSGVKAAGWPCTQCETVVPFDEMTCPTCGTGFLAGARGEPDILDRIGRAGLPKSTQAMIIAGGAFGIIAVVISALYIFGTIF